jgi:hypothetical protein
MIVKEQQKMCPTETIRSSIKQKLYRRLQLPQYISELVRPLQKYMFQGGESRAKTELSKKTQFFLIKVSA